jgi:hypothetical protein
MPANSQPTVFLKKLWQTIDLIGEEGAPRMTWESELGDDFPLFEKFLCPRDVAASILDSDHPGRILDLEELANGDFMAYSQEIPAHRAPFKIERAKVIRLILDVHALAAQLAKDLGFAAGNFGNTRIGNLHELGALTLPRQQPRPVFLFLSSLRPRSLALKESLIGVENAVVFLLTENGLTSDISNLANARKIELRILAAEAETVSIAPFSRRADRKHSRPPLITPRNGWQWKQLSISIQKDGIRAKISGMERFASWKELDIVPFNRGSLQGPLKVIGSLAKGGRLKQRRSNENDRQQISRARKFLCELFPLPGDPFHKFKDGWGLAFTVDFAVARAQVRDWKKEASEDEEATPIGAGQFDPDEIDGFSIHST